MKTHILTIVLLMCTAGLYAQNVGIGTDTPDASAKLDVTSTNSGVLVPRIVLTDVTVAAPVTAPATGLLVWNTNAAITGGNGSGFYYWNGTQWQQIGTGDHNTLDEAYDEGGAGAGRTIDAVDGTVAINGEDGLLVTGTYASGLLIGAAGGIPEGAGTRMFFNPNKAAFRAGNVIGTQWDNTSVGNYSSAMGYNTRASNSYSTAFGFSTTASGIASTAMGSNTLASGFYSTAMGVSSTASGSRSTAMGSNTTASGARSTAMGSFTTAPSYAETVIGAYNTNYVPASTTGWNASDRLFVVGNGTGVGAESDAIVILKNGDVGIGTDTPSNKLDINGDATLRGGTLHIWPSDAATQEGGQINLMKHGTAANGPTGSWAIDVFENDFRILNNDQVSPVAEFIRIDDVSGNVGIGTVSPAAKLDVVGDISVNTPFKFKLKNGADADNYLMYEPTVDGLRINGRDAVFITTSDFGNATNGQDLVVRDGRVGINTNTPSLGLFQVNGYYNQNVGNFTYYANGASGGPCCGGTIDVSIWATNRVLATEFNAFSDLRIKNVIGLSSNQEDLAILRELKITNYKFKDSLANNSTQKKLIAQQVEEVYPLAVSRTHNFIPDMYTLAHIDPSGQVVMENSLRAGDFIKLILKNSTLEVEVLKADAKSFVLDTEHRGITFFYGKKVDDFRVVDYEAISMLNVSATQALANELDKLKEENAALKRKNEELNSRVEQNSADIELLKVAMGQASK